MLKKYFKNYYITNMKKKRADEYSIKIIFICNF